MSELSKIKAILENLKPELAKRYYVSKIGLFGSVLNEGFLPNDEIDIIVDFSKPLGIGVMELTDFLENKLQTKIGLISKGSIDKVYLKEIKKEVLYI